MSISSAPPLSDHSSSCRRRSASPPTPPPPPRCPIPPLPREMTPLLPRLSLALCVSAAFLLLSCTGGGDGPAPPASSAAELAERFAPRLFTGPDDPFGPA